MTRTTLNSGVYINWPSQSIQQDSAHRLRRDSFSASGLSSLALQRSHRGSFSGSPPGQLNKETSLTGPHREARIAGGSRPGIVYPLPRAACPDTRLEVDAAPPEAAAFSRRLDGWRALAAQNHPRGVDHARPGATHANGPGTARLGFTGLRSAHHTAAIGVNSSLLPWYKQGIVDDLV